MLTASLAPPFVLAGAGRRSTIMPFGHGMFPEDCVLSGAAANSGYFFSPVVVARLRDVAPQENERRRNVGPFRLLNCIRTGSTCEVWEVMNDLKGERLRL